MSQLSTQIQDLLNKANFLSDAKEFYDPETASNFGATQVPSQPLHSGLPHDTRNTVGTPGNVFERLPARGGLPSALFNNSLTMLPSSHELRPDIQEIQWYQKGELDENRRICQYLYHASKVEVD